LQNTHEILLVLVDEGSNAEGIVVEGAQPVGDCLHFPHIADFQSVGELFDQVLLDVFVLHADQLLRSVEAVYTGQGEEKKIAITVE
jgi:hypothetical protein